MKKKYQVFVSSTYEDLKEERKAISQALLECDCIPAGMELFPASNQKSWDIIKKVIDDSDYYLIVIAGKYGSTTKDEDNKIIGYTEKEYNYACSINKPIIAFINNDVGNIVSSKVEETKVGKQRLEKFKNRIKDSNMQVSFWNNMGTLVSNIKTSIQELKTTTPAAGWIKGTEISPNHSSENFEERIKILEYWNLERIFRTRAEKNTESDPKLEMHDTKQLDGIAFGLSSFRSAREKDVLACLKNGMNMRLLIMNPNSCFVKQRALEEGVHADSISTSIISLVEWINRLNKKSNSGKIEIKYYNAMTLDFYWRMDDVVYVGPYLYNIMSQQTITYKFVKGGKGFDLYTDYFESLWNDDKLCIIPPNFVK